MAVYPGGVSRKELEQRFRQLEQRIRQKVASEVRAVYQISSGQSGGAASSSAPAVATIEYNQGTAASVWTIEHNLGRYPVVWTMDSAGVVFHGKVTHLSKVKLKIEFSTAVSGRALMV